jgi:hypothetical protein
MKPNTGYKIRKDTSNLSLLTAQNARPVLSPQTGGAHQRRDMEKSQAATRLADELRNRKTDLEERHEARKRTALMTNKNLSFH